MQHNQGLNPPDFDYLFNLSYCQQYPANHPLIVAFRATLDRQNMKRAEGLPTSAE